MIVASLLITTVGEAMAISALVEKPVGATVPEAVSFLGVLVALALQVGLILSLAVIGLEPTKQPMAAASEPSAPFKLSLGRLILLYLLLRRRK